MDFSGLDADSLRVVIECKREDLEELASKQKGKHREGETSDCDLAIELCKNDLEALEILLADRRMSASIVRAVRLDGNFICGVREAEDQIARDRQLAYALNGDREAPAIEARNSELTLDDELISKLDALYLGCPDEELPDQPESSAWAAKRTYEKNLKCTSCQDYFSFIDVARCLCSHDYCRECLATLFETAMKDETLFPPRCCSQPIPIDVNRIFLPPKLVGEFNAKKLELETPNRTYCHEPSCSTFVPLQFIKGNVAHCVRCSKQTCSICKTPSHEGECPQDPAVQELLRVATKNGWQRCNNCGRVVELEQGCNHMTCLCGHHFCYVCGVKWKRCRCVMWDEDRLYNRAAAIVDRDPVRRQREGAGRRAIAIQAEVKNLVANHECDHEMWTSRRGAHQCEVCQDILLIYIYECRQCRINACQRCRYNRL